MYTWESRRIKQFVPGHTAGNVKDRMWIYLSNPTFILFPEFDTAFQGCMTSVISLRITHTFIALVLISLPNSSSIFPMSLCKSQSQYIKIEFILLFKNHPSFDYTNYFSSQLSRSSWLKIYHSCFPPSSRCSISGQVLLTLLPWYLCLRLSFSLACNDLLIERDRGRETSSS